MLPAVRWLLFATLWMLAAAARVPLDPLPAAGAVLASYDVPPELLILLDRSRDARMELIKLRCEEHFLDFVELMWPAVDPAQPFVRGRVQEAIALHLEAVHHGKIKNLLANVPPGSTKTYLANVFFAAWEWGPRNRPDLRYMSWSYSPELSQKANEDCRKIIKHQVYQRFWGDRFQLEKDSDAKSYYANDKGGWRRSSSVRGAIMGFRADRLIWDDPHNTKDADSETALVEVTRWFARALPTRIRNASGDVTVKVPFWVRDCHGDLGDDPDDPRPVMASATIGIMQRVHLHDCSGLILKNPALGYEVLLIEMRYKGDQHPARRLPTWPGSSIGYKDWRTRAGELADPVRYPEPELAKLEASLSAVGGTDAVAAQLDQWPQEEGGSLFTAESLLINGQPVEPAEVPGGTDRRGWDFAGSESAKADETADARVRRGSDKRFYLMDHDVLRGGPGAVDGRIRARHAADPNDVHWSIPRDPGQAGIHQVHYIIRELTAGRYVHESPETGSKVTRAKPVSGQAAIGNFKIVRHPGWERARDQLIDFPYGTHDDIVDAISRAFGAVVALPGKQAPVGGFSFALGN